MVSFRRNKLRSWTRLLALAGTLFFNHMVHAQGLGLVSDHGQLSVSGANIVNQNGDIVQLRGMSSHALTARWRGPNNTDPAGGAPGLYTTKETIQWTRDHWGANAFRAALYVEGWGVADPRNWQYQNASYQRNGVGDIVEVLSPGGIFYSTEGGYAQEPARLHFDYMQNLFDVIDWAIELDMYVLVDWHVLEDVPNKYKDEAEMFFEIVSEKYAGIPNVIYEIANEPTDVKVTHVTEDSDANGWFVTNIEYDVPEWPLRNWVTWPELKAYAEDILPIIRANSPNAIATIGTPIFDQQIDDPINDRLTDPNVVYTTHFYACTHLSKGDGTDSANTDTFGNTDVFQNAQAAVAAGLPIFVSEWGTVKSSGDGNVCEGQTEAWIEFLNTNNISWFNWSMSGKDEGASVFTADLEPDFTVAATADGIITEAEDSALSTNLTETGTLVKCLMSDCGSTLDAADGSMTLSVSTTINLALLNGSPAGASYALIDDASGQATLSGNTVTFNANAGFTGGLFTYQIQLGDVTSNIATVDVNVDDNVTCDWHLDQDTDFYNNHWNGTLLVSNNGASDITGWTIDVTTAANTRLGSVWWTAPVYSNSTENSDGTVTYSVSDQGWDGSIPAGGSRQVVITGHVLSDLQSWEPGFNGFDQSSIESFAGDCASSVNGLINYDFNFMTPTTGSTISDSRNYIELHWFNDTDEVPVIRDENGNTFSLTPGFYPGPNETWRGVEVATFANKVTGRFDQWAAATGLDMSSGTHSWVLDAGGSVSDPFTFTAAITSHDYTCELELVTIGIPDNLYTWIGRLKITNVGSTPVTNWNTEFKWFEIPPSANANYWILGDSPHFDTFGSPAASREWQSYPNDPNNDFEEAKALVTPEGIVNIAPGASESYLVSASGLRATPRMYCGGLNN